MSEYEKTLKKHGWVPGESASPEYLTFLMDARRWLRDRPCLDETDRIGVLYWLAVCETIRQFRVPSKSDLHGRNAMCAASLAVAWYHEGYRDWESQGYGFVECHKRIDAWHRDRFLVSVRALDESRATIPMDRLGPQLVHGVAREAEPFASFLVWYQATTPDGESEAGKRRMELAFRLHDPESHENSPKLSDNDMASTLSIVEKLKDGSNSRSIWERDPSIPLGERASLVLNPDHVANALGTRLGAIDHKKPIEHERPDVSRDAGLDDEPHAELLEPKEWRHLQAIEQLTKVEQQEQIAAALEALRASATPGTARHALLSTEGLVMAVLLDEGTRVDAARTLGLEVDTVGKAVQRIVRDLRDELAA